MQPANDYIQLEEIQSARASCRDSLLSAFGKFAVKVLARVIVFAVVTLLVKFIVAPGTPLRVYYAIGGFLVIGVGGSLIAVMGVWLAGRYSVLRGELASLEARVRTGEQVSRPARLPGASAVPGGSVTGARS